MTEGLVWGRDAEAISLSKDGGVYNIVHTGKWEDWALSERNLIPVQPGEVFEFKADAAFTGVGNVFLSVITRDKDGQVFSYIHGRQEFEPTDTLTTVTAKFAIPRGVATIEPRVVGEGPATVRVTNLIVQGMGKIPVDVSAKFVKENKFLKVEFTNDVFSVTDKRTGRVWSGHAGLEVLGMGLWEKPDQDSFRMYRLGNTQDHKITITLEPDAPEFTVRIETEGPMGSNLEYPPPFESKSGDRLIIPQNEGISYPVDHQDVSTQRLIAYGGWGICMAFWGQIEDATGAGMVSILETPDDAAIEIARGENKLLQVCPSWEPSLKQFRYARQLRYVFFDEGGHVAVCKRYRQYAKEIGLLVPFTEKVKKNPNIDKLFGAANIWVWDWDWLAQEPDWKDLKIDLVKEMQSLGMTRLIWSSVNATIEEVAEINKLNDVLTSRYDNYQDVMNPEHFDVVGRHPDWHIAAWPNDINWTKPDGTWRRGWEVDQKDSSMPRIACGVLCDSKATSHARAVISTELETKPYTARFIDTTVAAPWFECYHPDHPMTRSDSRKHKMELLKLAGDLGLVCASETGHDAAVPFCDYLEGMMTIVSYQIPDSGRDMIQIIDEVPPQIEQFQVNPALRLPLWELVYHDCTVAQWYWGDYNSKMPSVWKKRDLFNALYGTPPTYMFTRKNWDANKDKFVESYKTATTVARAAAYAEMTDHQILTSDRMVQKTVFSTSEKSISVVVNFGETPFTFPDGTVLNGLDWKRD